jgi:uncharacterized BrkB/YihY/UPF0761 family membrane protein
MKLWSNRNCGQIETVALGGNDRVMQSKSKSASLAQPLVQPMSNLWQPRRATLVMLALLAASGVIVGGWFAGEGTITKIFKQIELLQEHPPMWLEVPMVTGSFLLVPTIMLLVALLAVMRVSPRPKAWSRIIVVGILLALTLRTLHGAPSPPST